MGTLVTRLRQLGSGVVGTISGSHCPLVNQAAKAIEERDAVIRELIEAVRTYGHRTIEGTTSVECYECGAVGHLPLVGPIIVPDKPDCIIARASKLLEDTK